MHTSLPMPRAHVFLCLESGGPGCTVAAGLCLAGARDYAQDKDHLQASGDMPIVHSITLSARIRSDCGMVTPSVLAVFRLMTSSNCVGCSMGRSPGLAPLRIL